LLVLGVVLGFDLFLGLSLGLVLGLCLLVSLVLGLCLFVGLGLGLGYSMIWYCMVLNGMMWYGIFWIRIRIFIGLGYLTLHISTSLTLSLPPTFCSKPMSNSTDSKSITTILAAIQTT
jgi:hypothetical protein